MDSLETQIRFASQLARNAGELIIDIQKKGNLDVRRKKDKSFLTRADMQSHELVVRAIQEQYPDHTVISEEDAEDHSVFSEDGPTWIIDPLDGTSNFVHSIPLFGTALAFVDKKKTIFSLFFDPTHDEMFLAKNGGGATLNGKVLSVSDQKNTRGAMMFAGRGYGDKDQERHGKIIFDLERETTYFRRLGSASVMLSLVAAGRADSVILTGNNPWDLVPGALLVEEAGGKVTDYCGNPWTYSSRDLIASNGIIHDGLVATTDKNCVTCP